MPHYLIYIRDGPCKGQRREIDEPEPPTVIFCRGTHYVLDPPRSEGVALVYATPHAVIDDITPDDVRGKRQVYQAWHRLTHVATHRVARDVRKIRHARARMRRAVR